MSPSHRTDRLYAHTEQIVVKESPVIVEKLVVKEVMLHSSACQRFSLCSSAHGYQQVTVPVEKLVEEITYKTVRSTTIASILVEPSNFHSASATNPPPYLNPSLHVYRYP